MMREILFRGKRMDNEEWVKGDLIREPWGYCIQVVDGDGNLFTRKKYAIDTSTVGQYTGLLDKNGKHIFEGDILKTGILKTYIAFFERGAFYLVADTTLPIKYADRFEVIGNIYDNLELL